MITLMPRVGRLDDRREVVAQAVVGAGVRISACASECLRIASSSVFQGTGP